MTLDQLNRLPVEAATDVLLGCCASWVWARRVAEQRPYANSQEVLDAADRIWLQLGESDWLEAFGAHPRIGEQTGSAAARQEQAGALGASEQIRRELAEANAEYEKKFDFIYIVFATGKTPEEMLELLRARLGNDRDTELRNAAGEQMKITRLRLQRLLELV